MIPNRCLLNINDVLFKPKKGDAWGLLFWQRVHLGERTTDQVRDRTTFSLCNLLEVCQLDGRDSERSLGILLVLLCCWHGGEGSPMQKRKQF